MDACLLWPDQVLRALQINGAQINLDQAIILNRLDQGLKTEHILLALLARPSTGNQAISIFDQLTGLRLRNRQLQLAAALTKAAESAWPGITHTDPNWLLRRGQLALQSGQADALLRCAPPTANAHPLLHWLRLQALLLSGRHAEALTWVQHCPVHDDFPEAFELKARTYLSSGRGEDAAPLLETLLNRTTGSASAWAAVVDLNLQAGRDAGFALQRGLALHPHSLPLHRAHSAYLLQGRQSSLARRCSFRERCLSLTLAHGAITPQSDANLVGAYDHTGRSDFCVAIHPRLQARLPQNPTLFANLSMQVASQLAPSYASIASGLAQLYPADAEGARLRPRRPAPARLRLGLVCPDLRYHPVGRFLLMLLSAGFGEGGELHLIRTNNLGRDSTAERLDALAQQQGQLHNISSQAPADQLRHLRQLELDVAIDLAGWTSQNAGHLFGPRIAPLQANWLGYFASSGLPAMDLWIGDGAIFPSVMEEWHTEKILRLPRPFLAWRPTPDLPEGQVDVPAPPPATTPITFGCFNHLRKLGLPTLRLWARILDALPQARLALKAFTTDDPGVVSLLRRRMRSAGLDPERVVWLPTCPRPADHLRQYGLVDVALDPFPNGGCTTTCEALWMGVPVITLAGSHYVSRMATAVLTGADLPEWVCPTEEAYLQRALQAAELLPQLRAGRHALRQQLLASPLADAHGLGQALWQALQREFSALP